MISPASAQQYALHLDYNRVPGLYVRGIGGNAGVALTTVKTFTVFNVPQRAAVRSMDEERNDQEQR
jgi:hypothetical protein